jgi:hypothetical protein
MQRLRGVAESPLPARDAKLAELVCPYAKTPNSAMAGLADAAVIRSRTRRVVTGCASRISRLAPTPETVATCSHIPVFHRSTAIVSTRWPNRIASRTRITLNLAAWGNSKMASATNTPSSVAQNVSPRPSTMFAAAYCAFRRNHLVPLPEARDLEHLNELLLTACKQEEQRIIAGR